MNLQTMCFDVHLFETPSSESVALQAIGPVHRLGQLHSVRVYEYGVANSLNSRQVIRNAIQVLREIITQWSLEIVTLSQISNKSFGSSTKSARYRTAMELLLSFRGWKHRHCRCRGAITVRANYQDNIQQKKWIDMVEAA